MWRRRGRSGPLSCAAVVELVTAYLEGELPDRDAERVNMHLAGCPGCWAYVDQMRQTIATLGALPLVGLPEEACAMLTEAFRTWAPDRG